MNAALKATEPDGGGDDPTSPQPSTRTSRPDIALHLPRAGERIADYRVVEQIGEGAMGVVLLAEDERLQRPVAIKLLRQDHRGSRFSHIRFLDEARAMARVRHPNVVEIHALGEWRGSPYLVMEYIAGQPLSRMLERHGAARLALDTARSILDQLCRGVAAIHAAGIAHRDLKPGNVMVAQDGRVAVGDFGLARSWDAAQRDGHVSGTPAYLAPETAAATPVAPALATRADIYSLAVLAYELLTGRLPFDESDYSAMLEAHVSRVPPPPRSIRPELPPQVDVVLAAALAKNPAERTASVEQLRRALVEALAPTRRPQAVRILVADDDKSFRDGLARILVHDLPGAIVESVADGAAALAAVERNRPALAIFDLDMPAINGIELTAAARAIHGAGDMPIIVVTGHGSASDWRLLSELGAQACVLKPVDADDLVATVERLLAKRGPTRGG